MQTILYWAELSYQLQLSLIQQSLYTNANLTLLGRTLYQYQSGLIKKFFYINANQTL